MSSMSRVGAVHTSVQVFAVFVLYILVFVQYYQDSKPSSLHSKSVVYCNVLAALPATKISAFTSCKFQLFPTGVVLQYFRKPFGASTY